MRRSTSRRILARPCRLRTTALAADVATAGGPGSDEDPGPRHKLSMTLLMTPDMANFAGHVHGGSILKLLDQVAFTCASRYAQEYVVTLSVDRVIFRRPVDIGELLTLQASINYTGRTSMEVGVRVTAEDIRRHRVRHTNSCYFTMVAVDDQRRPLPVPPLVPTGTDERRRWDAALTRRAAREQTRVG